MGGRALLPLAPPDGAGSRVAIHLRHLAVHQHQVVGALGEQLHGFAPVGRGIRAIPAFLQHAHGDALADGVVFDG